ncbi:UDP-glycosyltransferase 91C1-like [Papaver somniferum]|uniref:UDP-glycosyltransferase 91C1-like n=1 Tax=Papaver somniferum TaxID=3469 RepID=UPI000E6F5FEF|nr:UDP-glycosyltransferase 91C1-like [Papaver somniferum]
MFLAFLGPTSGYRQANSSRRQEYLTKVPEWIPFSSRLAYRYHEAVRMNRGMNTKDATGLSAGERLAKGVEGCNFLVVKSCVELDGEYLNLLQDLYRKPVIPICLLPPPGNGSNSGDSGNSSDSAMFHWLDKQQPKTAVYLSFDGSNLLPFGFEKRIRGRGNNARFLVEKGLGFEVERNEDGSFTRAAVAKSMRILMVEPEGQQLRQKAAEMSKSIFSNQDLQGRYMHKFISSLGFTSDYGDASVARGYVNQNFQVL